MKLIQLSTYNGYSQGLGPINDRMKRLKNMICPEYISNSYFIWIDRSKMATLIQGIRSTVFNTLLNEITANNQKLQDTYRANKRTKEFGDGTK